MDPYLENPSLWPDVHSRLMNEISDLIEPFLPPSYITQLETQILIDRVSISGPPTVVVPDVTVSQPSQPAPPFPGASIAGLAVAPATLRTTNQIEIEVPFRQISIEIRTVPDEQVVTIIELLSPINKREDDEQYERKRERILLTSAHLLEIDLLRSGQRIKVHDRLPDAPYFIFLSRGDERPDCDIWVVRLQEPLPVVPVPLLGDDPDVPLDLGAALKNIYDRARYSRRVNYTAAPVPPLSGEDAIWADALLREKGLRS